MKKHTIVAIDFESIIVPEIWDAIANATGVDDLHLTTRDIPDFTELMGKRLDIISKNDLRLRDMQKIAEEIAPLEGGKEFLNWLRQNYQVVIISDTFYEFVEHLLQELGYPTLFCNSFETNGDGELTDYYRRNSGGKSEIIQAFKHLGFEVIAVGDSYNDIEMMKEADHGFLLHSSQEMQAEFPQFPAFDDYSDLKTAIQEAAESRMAVIAQS